MDKSKMYFWDVLSLLIIVIMINIIFFVMPLLSNWKTSFTPARTITITAQGMTVATPDEADISFSVFTQGQNPQTLSDNNNQKMSAVLQFISSQGIASSDIATTGYDLEPTYQYNPTTQRNFITGYSLTQTVQVKIRDLTKVASVLGGLAPLGVNEIGGVNFTFQDPNKFIAIARGDALTNAAAEAGQLAAQANASLGPVITVTESSYVPTPLPIYSMAAGSGAAMPEAVNPTIAPGTQNVTDNVTVTYALQ